MNQNIINKVHAKMTQLKTPCTIEQLSNVDTCEQKYIKFALWDLLKQGKVERVSRGVYKVTNAEGQSFEFELMFGLEIEAEYNKGLLGQIQKSSYHTTAGCQKLASKWFCERDGSLRQNNFLDADTCEFISMPTPKSGIDALLKQFQKAIQTKAGKACTLKEALKFNESTGAHVHISMIIKNGKETKMMVRNNVVKIKGQKKEIKFVPVHFMINVGKLFKKQMKKDLPHVYETFRKKYYRTYAKRANKMNAYTNRTNEFNYTTSYGTIEYRSPNLHGVETWKDFFKFYEILTDVLQKAFEKELAKNNPFGSVENIEMTVETEETNNEINEIINTNKEEETHVHY